MTFDATTLEAARRLAEVEASYGRKDAPIAKTPDQPTTSAGAVPTQTALEAEYQCDPKLQHEFGDMSAYCAYRRAEAKGAIKLLRRVA